MNKMNLPGFTAELSMQKTSRRYRTIETFDQASVNDSITLSGSCTCTALIAHGCVHQDPCAYCLNYTDSCDQNRCICSCAGGFIHEVTPTPNNPCGFVCF
jgi:hypothetical protein